MERFSKGLLASLAIMAAALLFPAAGAAKTIKVTSTIGAAISAADPGDTMIVAAWDRTTRVDWCVTKDDLTIRGSKAAVLDASGN